MARALIIVALLGQAAVSASGQLAWTRTDSWYRPSPESWSRNASRLASSRVTAVPTGKNAVVEKLLAKTSATLLSPAEASSLAGVVVRRPKGMRLYLVRAVYLNEFNGGFEVSEFGTELEVHHGSLGRRPLPMKRGGVIVQLSSPPTNVYVTCSMAE
jgi:hypothetical protein